MSPSPEPVSDAALQLKLRRVAIDTYRENVAYLHRRCPIYKAEGFQALSKIVVSTNGTRIIAVLNVVDDDALIAPDEIGLSEQAFAQFGQTQGCAVRVDHAEPAQSMAAVRKKIDGWRLRQEDLYAIIRDIAENRYSKMEMAAFLVASGQNGLDREEILDLTRAMIDTGERLEWDSRLVVDKHCIGGIPGNRTTMLVVPILAAHGLTIPKTSSRAITSPAGTADTMEVLAKVRLSPQEMRTVVGAHRACLAWGGNARLAPVDDILIAVERPLGIDSVGQMVASILSKKVAAGSTHLLLDIPVGPTAKVRHMNEAQHLRKMFEYIGDRLGLHVEVVVTDGSQPIGRGIGPVLEARDVMQVLRNDPDAPQDLRQKALRMAGRLLEFAPDVRGGYGLALATDLLESGQALAKMEAIIDAQGRVKHPHTPGRLTQPVLAARDGVVTAIDNQQIARIASLAGAPIDKGAGVDLHRKLGDAVKRGEPLYTIHGEFPADFQFAASAAAACSGYEVGEAAEMQRRYLEL